MFVFSTLAPASYLSSSILSRDWFSFLQISCLCEKRTFLSHKLSSSHHLSSSSLHLSCVFQRFYHQSRLVSAQVGGGAILCHVSFFGSCEFDSFLLQQASGNLQHNALQDKLCYKLLQQGKKDRQQHHGHIKVVFVFMCWTLI